MKGTILGALISLSACCFFYRFVQLNPKPFLMNLFNFENPVGGKPLSIYIESIGNEWNSDVTKCSDCGCTFDGLDSLEPLIHCIIKKSTYITDSKKDATFILVPSYLNNLRKSGKNPKLTDLISDDYVKRWKGCRHVLIDSFLSQSESSSYMDFNEQPLLITTNLSIEKIRDNRWMNSRHILVPPLQLRNDYQTKTKTRDFLFLGNSEEIKKLAQKPNSLLIDTFSDKEKVLDEVSVSKFTIIHPNDDFLPFFIYEVLRSNSIPILLSEPFLPAFANSLINYTKVSIRIPIRNISSFDQRVSLFDSEKALAEISKIKNYLMWPKNGIAKSDNAGGVLLDYLNIRHRVIRPVLRRTFIGSDKFIP